MNQPLPKKTYYTKEEYLEIEEQSEFKSEYFDGEIFAMAGGTPAHSAICVNLIRRVAEAIDQKDCIAFDSNLKLEIERADSYVYPDVMVVCGPVELVQNRNDTVKNPLLIIEVLSPGTESFDRGKKFRYYMTLPSFKEYILVSQEKPRVEVYFRQNEKNWTYSPVEGLDETVRLQSLETQL